VTVMTARQPTVTRRQLDLLRAVAAGDTYAEIARRTGGSVPGVKSTLLRLKRHLGARSAAHAVHLAHQAGLLDRRPDRHGDHAGYTQHVRRGEEPRDCPSCHAGELAYRAQRRAARTTTTKETSR
jgi:DNA-binding CsgD family transcriptional regulator